MTEQQRNFNLDRAAMDAVSCIQDVFGTGYLDRFDAQRFAKIQDIIADTIQAALSHAEGVQHLVDASVTFVDGVGAGRNKPSECREGLKYITAGPITYWPLSTDDEQRLRRAECGDGEFHGPTVSHAEGEAPVGHFYNRPQEGRIGVEWCCEHLNDGQALYAHPAPQVAVPERDLLKRYRQAVEKTHRTRCATPAALSTDLNRALVEQERVESEIDALLAAPTGEQDPLPVGLSLRPLTDLIHELDELCRITPVDFEAAVDMGYADGAQDLHDKIIAECRRLAGMKRQQPVSDPDGIIDRLRGQLQNCINHLERAKNQATRSRGEAFRACIEQANAALYETLGYTAPAPDEREIAASMLEGLAQRIDAGGASWPSHEIRMIAERLRAGNGGDDQ